MLHKIKNVYFSQNNNYFYIIPESAVNAEVVKNSKLSASAKEFVPQSYNPTLATGVSLF